MGEEPGLESRAQSWTPARGRDWNPVFFPKPRDKDRGGDHHPCGDRGLSMPLPRCCQYCSPARGAATRCPPGQGSPSACDGPAGHGHHPASQRGHGGTGPPKATQRTGGGHGQGSVGLTPRPPSFHSSSQPLPRHTPHAYSPRVSPNAPSTDAFHSQPRPHSAWGLLTPALSQGPPLPVQSPQFGIYWLGLNLPFGPEMLWPETVPEIRVPGMPRAGGSDSGSASSGS